MRQVAGFVRVVAGSRSDVLGFTSIFAASLAGFASVGVWAVAACAVALAALSYAEYYQLYRRGEELGFSEIVYGTALRSFGNALIVTGAAYGVGWTLRLM